MFGISTTFLNQKMFVYLAKKKKNQTINESYTAP